MIRQAALIGVVLTCAAPAAAQAVRADGLIVSEQRITISSQLSARIDEMPFGDSQRFAAGDTLVAFDCARLDAERAAQAAREAGATERHAINSRLGRSGAIARGALVQSQSEAEIARAELRALDASLKDCRIEAPFAGRVVETFANRFENAAPSQELMTIVDDRNLEVELIVPSAWLGWVGVGTAFQFALNETGATHGAEVTALGAVVDPVSRTIRLSARFETTPDDILPGMSGTALFDEPS